MKSVNQVWLLGNLTRDPEVRTTPKGQDVCTFSLALNREYKGGESVDYIDCVAWGNVATHISQYLNKGSSCSIVGRLSQRKYQKDGIDMNKVEVVVSEVTFIGGKND